MIRVNMVVWHTAGTELVAEECVYQVELADLASFINEAKHESEYDGDTWAVQIKYSVLCQAKEVTWLTQYGYENLSEYAKQGIRGHEGLEAICHPCTDLALLLN